MRILFLFVLRREKREGEKKERKAKICKWVKFEPLTTGHRLAKVLSNISINIY